MNTSVKTILVTGASGYLASWIVQKLLEEGHNVHATVRNLKDYSKIEHLLAMGKQYSAKLKLFESDLLKEGSFDKAMQGCEIVMHTASPYFLHKPKSVEKELIKPALEGTKNLLESVNNTKSVTRVILTSSIAALYNNAKDLLKRAGNIVRESDLNKNHDMNYNPYAYSKTQAESLAWSMQKKQDRWEMITVHPGAIFGPSLSKRKDATSVDMLIKFLDGSYKTGVPKLWLGVVDVRDAAQVHIFAALKGKAEHRYIAMSKTLRLLEIAKLLDIAKFDLADKLPKKEISKTLIWLIAPLLGLDRRYIANNVNYHIDFDNTLSIDELGIEYHSPFETLNDHIAQLVRDKIV